MMLALRDDYDEAADAINWIEWIRRQLYDLRAVMEERDDAGTVLEGIAGLDEKLIAVEEELIQLRTTGTGQDGVRYPAKVIGKLEALVSLVPHELSNGSSKRHRDGKQRNHFRSYRSC